MGLPALTSILRVFPSRAALEQALAASVGDADVVAADGFVTFSGLADVLAGGARVAASSVMARFVARQAMASGPAHYRDLVADPVAVRGVHGALLELRTCGITSQAVARTRGPTPPELADLLAVLAVYEDGLAAHQLVDDADKWRAAVLAVARGDLPPQLAGIREVVIEGDADLFGSRREIVSAFAKRGLTVRVRLPFDEASPADFAWSEASLALLEARDSDSPLSITLDPRRSNAVARVMHVPEPSEEARRVAMQVAEWLHAGVPASAIAVAMPDPDGVGELILDALRRNGIPAHCLRGRPVIRVRRVAAIVAAMGLRIGSFRREELLDVWMALGSTVTSEGGAISVSRLAREVRASGARSLEVRAYREALQQAVRSRPGARGTEMAAARSDRIADALDSFIASWSRLPERAPLSEHIAVLAPLVAAVRSSPREGDADDVDGMTALEDIIGDMAAVARALGAAQPVLGYDELYGWLRLLLSERRVPMRMLRAGSVVVGTLDDIVGARYQCVAIAGVDGDSFPRRAHPDLVLTDACREALNRRFATRLLQSAPIDGRAALENDARDRWLWREALAAARDSVLVTYGVREGREVEGRSDVVADLLRARGLTVEQPLPTYADAAVVAPAQALETFAFTCVAEGVGLAAAPRHVAGELQTMVAGDRAAWITRRARYESAHLAGRLPVPLASEDVRLLEEHAFARAHSVSSLDKLGRCAFLHFGASTLRLREDELPGLAPEAREDGRAAHEGLRYVYRDLMRHGGLKAARLDPVAAKQRAHEAFVAAHDAILREVPIHPALAPATLAQAWRAVVAQLEADLAATHELEPIALEYGFDGDTLLRMRSPDGARELMVRGNIDRVDQGHDVLVTLDYKSSPPKFAPGRHFQLAIYGAVVARDFAQHGERLRAAWLELHTAKEALDEDLMGGTKTSDVTSFVQRLHDALWPRVERLLSGNIAPDPAPASICETCDMRALCRARELVSDDGGDEVVA